MPTKNEFFVAGGGAQTRINFLAKFKGLIKIFIQIAAYQFENISWEAKLNPCPTFIAANNQTTATIQQPCKLKQNKFFRINFIPQIKFLWNLTVI